jgi:spectinomycin phosphotransferase
MFESVKQILSDEYGIRAGSLQEVPPGWSAAAWRVHSDCGDFFLKIYDKHKPSTKSWVARIDDYMPVTLWLHDNTKLGDKMIAPILTKNGSYKWEDADFLYMVFPFIEGQTIGSSRLKPKQVHEVAQIVAQLHLYGAEIPIQTDSLKESFDVSFCDSLNDWLKGKQASAAKVLLASFADTISQAVTALQSAASSLRKSEMCYALCHTDIHGWNLMQSERVILIDWEGLKLAPVEADLFSFTDTFFFDYAWEDFMSAYRSVHRDYKVHPEAMRFYRLRRRLEDIHAFAESLLFDNVTQEDEERSLHYLNEECVKLSLNIDN